VLPLKIRNETSVFFLRYNHKHFGQKKILCSFTNNASEFDSKLLKESLHNFNITFLKVIYRCEINGIAHHVAATMNQVAEIVYEALVNYLGWNVLYHKK
jgi:hypothetical protein